MYYFKFKKFPLTFFEKIAYNIVTKVKDYKYRILQVGDSLPKVMKWEMVSTMEEVYAFSILNKNCE